MDFFSFRETMNKTLNEAKLSTKKRFDMYKNEYGIDAHDMADAREAEKVIRFILNDKKDLMPDQMKMLVDKGFFKEGIKQNIEAHFKTYKSIANMKGLAKAGSQNQTDADRRKQAEWMAKRFNNNAWIRHFDYNAFIKKHLK